MRTVRILFMLSGALIIAAPAMANQAPEPPLFLAEALILPVMMILTALGGGYAILRTQTKEKASRNTWKIIVLVLVVLFSTTHEGLGAVVALSFGIYALGRALKMLAWGLSALRKNRPEHLASARPPRLLAAGALLMVATLFLTGLGVASLGTWKLRDSSASTVVRNVVAYELAYARLQQEQTGQARFDLITAPNPNGMVIEIVFSDALDRFTLDVLPSSRMPFWPFNYILTQPAYHADETGEVRKTEVTSPEQRCPEDAPVVWKVEPYQIEDYLKFMRQGEFRPPYMFERGAP